MPKYGASEFNHYAAVGACVKHLHECAPNYGPAWAVLDYEHQALAMRDELVRWAQRGSKRMVTFDRLPGQEQAAIIEAAMKFRKQTWEKLDFSTGKMQIKI